MSYIYNVIYMSNIYVIYIYNVTYVIYKRADRKVRFPKCWGYREKF